MGPQQSGHPRTVGAVRVTEPSQGLCKSELSWKQMTDILTQISLNKRWECIGACS